MPYPRAKNPQLPFNKGLGGPQSQFEHFGAEKIFLPLLEIEIWTIQSVAI